MEYIKLDVFSDIEAPPFIGSMVRGALGASLKKIVCINPSYRCLGCFAAEECIYFKMYEKQPLYQNYRLDIEIFPQKLDFSIFLFGGEYTSKTPYILSAIEKMFKDLGFGRERKKSSNFLIKSDDQIIYSNGKFQKNILIKPKKLNLKNDSLCRKIKVKFKTPLRVKKRGRFVKPDQLTAEDILISAFKKRKFFLSQEKKDLNITAISEFPVIRNKKLSMLDFERYSNKQKTKMKFGGLVGEIILDGLTPQTYELLRFSEIAGIGKQTTFGLGKIKVEDLR